MKEYIIINNNIIRCLRLVTKEDVDQIMNSDMFYEYEDNPVNMNYL